MPINYCALGFSEDENKMFQDAEEVINKENLWEWLSDHSVIKSLDYNISAYPELQTIRSGLKYNHTDKTFIRTMSEMCFLAINGIDKYCSHYTQKIAAPNAPKKGLTRTAEMDKKVLEEYASRPPFAKAPKWSYEYIKAFPDVLRNLPIEKDEFKRPGVSDPTARRLNF